MSGRGRPVVGGRKLSAGRRNGAIPAIILAFLVSWNGVASGAARSPLDRLRERWMESKSLVVKFVQTQRFEGFDDPLESRGTLKILRPSFFSLKFDPPNRQTQICDGTFVWTFLPDQNQVVKTPLVPEGTRSADLLDWALQGASLVSDTTDATMGTGGIRLDLHPGDQLPLRQLSIWMRESDGSILGYDVTDMEGNWTRMRFVDVKKAKNLTPADFAFKVPSGIEVVEMGESR
jgi:outer membrane lipoprotein-sorting protein